MPEGEKTIAIVLLSQHEIKSNVDKNETSPFIE